MAQSKLRVGILGATGLVGQRYLSLLENHPWFDVTVLAASEKSAGKPYRDAANWLIDATCPEKYAGMIVQNAERVDDIASQVDFVFSSLPGEAAGKLERQYAKRVPVISKASTHRMDADTPLLIPEVNPQHLGMIEHQRRVNNTQGFVSTDPNCSTIQLAMALAPLQPFGLTRVIVTSMQALSGAGYPGVPSMDVADNVIPYINGEESKVQDEPLKILGVLDDSNGKIKPAALQIAASCNRVPVTDGHLESVFVELTGQPSIADVERAFETFTGEPQRLGLPSAPLHPIVVRKEANRPQTRLDRLDQGGMSTVIGRVRKTGWLYAFSCLGHNTLRGAAGNGVLHAELLKVKGYLA